MKRLTTFIGLGILTSGIFSTTSVQAGAPAPDCYTPPSGIVAWWPAEGNANDIVGGNDGILQNGVAFASGEVGQAFLLNNSTNAYMMVPASSSLKNIGVASGLTIEGWIDVAGVSGFHPIAEFADGVGDFGVQLWLGSNPSDNGLVYAALVDTNEVYHQLYSPQNAVVPNVFQHIALTYDKASGVGTLYVNGAVVAQSNFGNFTPETGYDFWIGHRQGDGPGDWTYGTYLGGLLDELTVYKRALSSNEVAAIYNAGSAGKCAPVLPPVPAISSFTPLSGTNGAVVKIYGTNFDSTPANDIVYFGSVRATVVSASATNLNVMVPVGAIYAPITVTVGGLTAYSRNPFMPTYNGIGPNSPVSFASRLDMPAIDGVGVVDIVDLDGDGKPDLLTCSGSQGISIYQNLGSSNGTLTADSFAPRVDLALPDGLQTMTVADVDGDGKMDIVFLNRNSDQVVILKNISTPGILTTNSFAAPVAFPTGSDPRGIVVQDLDGDGKPELVVANWGDSTIDVLQNIGQPGSIDTNTFAPAVVYDTGANPQGLVVADLDGDGLPDIITANNNYGTDNSVSILRNTSSLGNISFADHVDLAGAATSYWVAVGDLDGDGKLDLAVSSFIDGQAVSVYRNTSTPGSITTNSFAPHVDFDAGGWGNAVAIGDLDGDGKPDLAVVTQLPDHFSIFQNISTPGSFTTDSLAPRVDYAAGWNPNGVVIGDLDGDGRPDIIFAVSYAATLSIYQNQTPVNGPPVIQTQPASQTVVEGSSMDLSVAAAGSVPLAYQWRFNGATLPGATNATLTLTNIHPYQAGNYQVRVTNPYGTVTSSNAVVTVTAQDILVYKYSGTTKVTTTGLESSYAYSGQMFFIPATTNGTFVGWAVINGKKQFWVNPFSDYLLIPIHGSAGRTYTMLGKAGEEIDDGGYTHIWSYLHKGLNAPLAITKKRSFSFPNTFSAAETHVYPDSQTANMILLESVSTYTFLSPNTQAANTNGQTMADLVKALTNSLLIQGYQQQQN